MELGQFTLNEDCKIVARANRLLHLQTVASSKQGFTLVELLVGLAIVGVLAGLLLPAVQGAREASRRMACQSNLRNHAIAILSFEQMHSHLPPGRNRRNDLDWSWGFYILPMLEQSSIYLSADSSKAWDDPINDKAVSTTLPIFRCPSSAYQYRGDCDYAGLTGTVRGASAGQSPFDRGSLVYVDSEDRREISLASVTDGASHTLCVSENHDLVSPIGRWASGLNCVSHDIGRINSTLEGIRSLHPSGANAVSLDGAAKFLSNHMHEDVLASLLTRNGNEPLTFDE